MTKKHRQEALAQEAREKVWKPLTEDDDLNNVRYKAKYRYETTSYEELLDAIEKLKARIKVLEKALIASEQDYENLLKERGTVEDAWQKYCEEIMPQKTGRNASLHTNGA
jgi:hypothetical protein